YDYGPISRDKRYLALIKARTTSDNDVYLYEIPTRATKLITKHEGAVLTTPQDFTPDSRSLLYTSDEGSEFASLRAYSIDTDKSTVLLNPKWDVVSAVFSPRGKRLTAVINE